MSDDKSEVLKNGEIKFLGEPEFIGSFKARGPDLPTRVVVDDSALFRSSEDPGKDPCVPYLVLDEDGVMKHLTQVFSGRVWAREFMKTYKFLFEQEKEIDEELMHTWFANAIMAGYDFQARNTNKEFMLRRKAMELAASMCGNPDPAEGCRQILNLFKDVEKQLEDSDGISTNDSKRD
jgi:hypothetical protein